MAFTSVGNWGVQLVTDVELNASAETISAVSAAVVLYALEIDNSDNSEDVYVKLYNASPTVGTTAPYVIIRVNGGETFPYIPSGLGEGVTFPAGLYAVAVTSGGTAGSGNPTNPVRATFLTD